MKKRQKRLPTAAMVGIAFAVGVVVGMAVVALKGEPGSSATVGTTTTTSSTTTPTTTPTMTTTSGTTTTTTGTTTSPTTPSGPDTSKFNFENEDDNMGWTKDSGANITFAPTTSEHKYGSGSLQCTLSGCGAGPGGGSQFQMRARLDAIGLPYMNDLSDKTLSVWVKFPAEIHAPPYGDPDWPAATMQVKMYLFWEQGVMDDNGNWVEPSAWIWVDSGEPPFYLRCDGDWELLEWDLSTVEGHDLTRVVAVGLQFGEWGMSAPWNGTFWIDAYDWS